MDVISGVPRGGHCAMAPPQRIDCAMGTVFVVVKYFHFRILIKIKSRNKQYELPKLIKQVLLGLIGRPFQSDVDFVCELIGLKFVFRSILLSI